MDVQTEVFLLAENRLLREALIRILAKKTNIRVVGAAPYSPATMEQIISQPQDCCVGFRRSGVFRHQTSFIAARCDSRCAGRHDRYGPRPAHLLESRWRRRGWIRLERRFGCGSGGYDPGGCRGRGSVSTDSVHGALPDGPSSSFRWDCEPGAEWTGAGLATLLRERLTNKEIAAHLILSEQTVKNHVHRMLRKIGAKDEHGHREAVRTGRSW